MKSDALPALTGFATTGHLRLRRSIARTTTYTCLTSFFFCSSIFFASLTWFSFLRARRTGDWFGYTISFNVLQAFAITCCRLTVGCRWGWACAWPVMKRARVSPDAGYASRQSVQPLRSSVYSPAQTFESVKFDTGLAVSALDLRAVS